MALTETHKKIQAEDAEFASRGLRRCRKCQEPKPFEAFWKATRSPDGMDWYCSECRKAMRESSGHRHKYDAGYVRDRTYGLTPGQYAELLFLQGGVCKICGGTNKDNRALYVDHDHETGRVRGLLCHACNTGISNFRDDLELLQAAIAYLRGE